MFILGYIHQNIAGKFASNLVFSVVLENLIYAKPIQKYVYLSQSYSIGCSLANPNKKGANVIQIRLIARRALAGY